MPISPLCSPFLEENLDRLGDAVEVAVACHAGQLDKQGKPYIRHVLRVGLSLLPDIDAAVVGFLHDALEDSPAMREAAVLLLRPYLRCWEAALAITRMPFEEYDDYLLRLSACPLAVKVKRADIADNLRADRLRLLDTETCERLTRKYVGALKVLDHHTRNPKE